MSAVIREARRSDAKPISELMQQLGYYNIQPSPRLKYKGKLLKDIYEAYYSEGE
ncbi:hypothetical protein [Saccharospirillum sp. MSK14-1]|uniref:hypothetical protein n=1 Tax=Saccharospirillum sp. MSK14-1 TaxID=1897632 RepID=UPI001304A21D|nr:hypothetical protein [Saccharospirillum sp. MSK14-1]